LAFIIYTLPWYFLAEVRPDYKCGAALNAALLYVSFNTTTLLIWSFLNKNIRTKLSNILRKLLFISDFLFPLLLWDSYWKKENVIKFAVRIIPVMMICSGVFFALLINPPEQSSNHNISKNLSKIVDGRHYKLEINDQSKIVALSLPANLSLIDPKSGKVEKHLVLDDWKTISFQTNRKQGRILLFTNLDYESHFWEVDMNSLEIVNSISYNQTAFKMFDGAFTFWKQKREIFLDVGESGVLKIDPSSSSITKALNTQPSHSVLDPNRPRFYMCYHGVPGFISANDTSTLKAVKRLKVPKYATRMAIDGTSDRLFIAFPAEGIIRVLDLESFHLSSTISSFAGVRWIYIDQKRRLLFLGGFTPYLEIRSVDNFRLISRIVSPAWTRTMITDQVEPVAYIASQSGIFRLDISEFENPSLWKILINRADLFFPLVKMALPIMRHFKGMDLAPDAGRLPDPIDLINK